jgi:hypothetical protein
VLLQVFLSATLSNAREFSEWVAHLHKQPCHVVYTDFRPTPLHHFVVPVAGQGMYKVRQFLICMVLYGNLLHHAYSSFILGLGCNASDGTCTSSRATWSTPTSGLHRCTIS